MGSDEEPQRFLGLPRPPGGWRSLKDSDEPRVLGVPRGWIVLRSPDLRWLRHPVWWTRWRLARRREGAFVPGFSEFIAGKRKAQN